ncbi:glutaredoxin-c9 [Phtheirospermum japonicum]|uniref:Glutaredoxin-c9 n=1 Tax=Phtheirospermum japonicum TaxID=374723 RepID=A0A830CJT4_9LAMI|nr:glutaredoxin-c9 [Phtheirospermum japonicum]
MLPAAANPTPENKNSVGEAANNVGKSVRDLVAENAVMVFGRKGCCMCHVVKLLLQGHGVNPTVLDVDEQNEADVTRQWSAFHGIEGPAAAAKFPAVFVGGELLGGLDEIMGAHISGELVPRLRAAGALWL